MFPSYRIEPPEGKIVLYHNTTDDNVQSILANGLKASAGKTQGRGKDGDFVWATSTPNLKGYGGNTIAFETDIDKANQYKVNNDQYTLPYDIPKEDILFVDKFFWDNYRLSDLPELIKKYGKDKVITIISKKPEKFHNNYNIDNLENLINQASNLTEGFCFKIDLFNMLNEDITTTNKYLPNPLPEPLNNSFKTIINKLKFTTKNKYKYFSDSNTHFDYYDIGLGNIEGLNNSINKGQVPLFVEMTPQEYINYASAASGKTPEEIEKDKRNNDNGLSVNQIKKMMQDGIDFDIPYLAYTSTSVQQEGLHRAIAAKDLGVDKIPVFIVYFVDKTKTQNLTEANLYQLAVKTQNETPKLAARSDKVTPSYLGISKFGIYNFRVTSQTHAGNYWYQTIECPSLLNLDEILDEPNGHITARDIQIMLRQDNVKILCDCPAFLYWALKYMAWDDNYGIEPETRHPRVNNVHLQGALCKHLMAVVKLIQSGSILDNIAKDTEQYLRFQRGETSRLHNNPKAMSQANKKTDQIDYKTDSSYLNDYFRSLAGKNSFLDDQDIKGSLEAEIKKVAQTSPNMTLDDFISEEFGVDGVSGLAQELQISQDYINKYFKDLGF